MNQLKTNNGTLSINLNILECKYAYEDMEHIQEQSINLNILECKSSLSAANLWGIVY